VRELESDGPEAALTRAIVALGQSLGLETIAEGVERTEQLEILRATGCPLAQGYLFARPLPVWDVERLLTAPSPVLAGHRAAAAHDDSPRHSEPVGAPTPAA